MKLLDWVWVDVGGSASREEMVKSAAEPAYLVMATPPPEKGGNAPPTPPVTKPESSPGVPR